MIDKNINLTKEYLNSYSIETTPSIYNKYGKFSDLVPKYLVGLDELIKF